MRARRMVAFVPFLAALSGPDPPEYPAPDTEHTVASSAVETLTARATPTQSAPQDVTCDVCHANRAFLAGKRPTPAQDSALFVPGALLSESVHQGLPCAACHPAPAEGYPHPEPAAIPCESCHAEEGEKWAISIHAVGEGPGKDGARCVDCHTPHEVFRADDQRAETHPLNVAAMCARCHADEHIIDEYFTRPEETQARVAVEQYYETVHGTALTQAGLAVSATCNDCHRGHDVWPGWDPRSSVHRDHVAATCEVCHIGIRERFERSAHGAGAPTVTADGEVRQPPVCTDCHTSHQIVRANEPAWFVGVVEECGACHQQVYDTYFETYHGQVTALGFALTAKCSDCHSPHRMLPASDRESTVHPLNLIETCAQCHPEANYNFVRYFAHGDHRDRSRYPVLFWTWALMTTLLVSVWSFFGLHSALWLGRVGLDRLRGRSRHLPPRKGRGGGKR